MVTSPMTSRDPEVPGRDMDIYLMNCISKIVRDSVSLSRIVNHIAAVRMTRDRSCHMTCKGQYRYRGNLCLNNLEICCR